MPKAKRRKEHLAHERDSGEQRSEAARHAAPKLLTPRWLTLAPAPARLVAVTTAGLAVEMAPALVESTAVGDDIADASELADAEVARR